MMYSAVIVCIVFLSVISIVRMALTHAENIERIRHGYPVKDGNSYIHKEEFIDTTERKQQ